MEPEQDIEKKTEIKNPTDVEIVSESENAIVDKGTEEESVPQNSLLFVPSEKALLTEEEIQLLRACRPDWYLWELGALHPVERKEFNEILNHLRQTESFSISANDLINMNIYPNRSSLLQKMVKNKRAVVTADSLTLTYEVITAENLSTKILQIETIYSEMMKNSKEAAVPFPTSHFRLISPNCIESFHLEKIGWKNLKNSQTKGKLIQIIFPDNSYPPILLTAEIYSSLAKLASDKVFYHMKKAAGDDEVFFNQKIENDKKKMAAQYPRLFDFDLMRLQKRSTRAYREEYTAIILEKMLNNKNLAKMLLADYASDHAASILRFFPPSNPGSFDLLQSFFYLKEITLGSDINNAIQLESLNKMIFESVKLFLSLEDIKANILKDFPDLGDEQFENVINRFFNDYIKKKNRNGIPQVYHFKITEGEYQDADIFIHHLNLNQLINGALERLEQKINTSFLSKWEERLQSHELDSSMFSDARFDEALFQYCRSEEPFVFKILKKPNIYRILESTDQLSRLTLRIRLYTHKALSKVFNIDKDRLYQTAYNNVIATKSFFSRIFFIILTWIYRKNFTYDDESGVENLVGDNEEQSVNVNDYLRALDFESENSLAKKVEELWSNLPNSLNRHELNENIKSDLFAFFRTRKEVPLFALEYIVDNNTNRILKKGQHLISYTKELTDYTRYQTYLTICQTSSLRKKINLVVKNTDENDLL